MLIEFRVTNFRSFKEPQIFSMVAGGYPEHAESNAFDPNLKAFEERLLRSAGIYGANAAGKTNLLRSLQLMQLFILNSVNITTGIPYNPFKFSSSTRHAPSEFKVTFVQHEIRYEYGFIIGSNQVEKEWLVEFVSPRGRTLFERKYDQKTEAYEWKFHRSLKGLRSQWSDLTRPNMLFLSAAIQWNNQQLLPVFEWFQKRLIIVAGETKLNAFLTLDLLEEQEGKETLLSFMQEADFGITNLEMKREPIPLNSTGFVFQGTPIIAHKPGQSTPDLIKVTLSHESDDDQYSNLDLAEESNGTQTFFKIAGAWGNVFKNGEILLVDEIESSFHPLLVRFLIQRFHSEKNKQNAQLIFTTHDVNLLSRDILRRDQIWFVEKDKTEGSKLYPLTDFKPRNDADVGRWYMRGRYGALPVLNESE